MADAAGLGMVVSKKLAGNSVRRNRVKRHAREAFRLCCADSQDNAAIGIEVVLRVSANIRTLGRAEQFAEISALFARCGANGRQERA